MKWRRIETRKRNQNLQRTRTYYQGSKTTSQSSQGRRDHADNKLKALRKRDYQQSTKHMTRERKRIHWDKGDFPWCPIRCARTGSCSRTASWGHWQGGRCRCWLHLGFDPIRRPSDLDDGNQQHVIKLFGNLSNRGGRQRRFRWGIEAFTAMGEAVALVRCQLLRHHPLLSGPSSMTTRTC